jgi:hypothetical protein
MRQGELTTTAAGRPHQVLRPLPSRAKCVFGRRARVDGDLSRICGLADRIETARVARRPAPCSGLCPCHRGPGAGRRQRISKPASPARRCAGGIVVRLARSTRMTAGRGSKRGCRGAATGNRSRFSRSLGPKEPRGRRCSWLVAGRQALNRGRAPLARGGCEARCSDEGAARARAGLGQGARGRSPTRSARRCLHLGRVRHRSPGAFPRTSAWGRCSRTGAAQLSARPRAGAVPSNHAQHSTNAISLRETAFVGDVFCEMLQARGNDNGRPGRCLGKLATRVGVQPRVCRSHERPGLRGGSRGSGTGVDRSGRVVREILGLIVRGGDGPGYRVQRPAPGAGCG